MRKLILSTLFTVFLASMLLAQDNETYQFRKYTDLKKVHWGFTAGVNKIDFSIYKNSYFLTNDTVGYLGIEAYSIPGFHLGPLVEFKLFKLLDLRFQPNITFTQRTLKYYFVSNDSNSNYILKEFPLASSFIEVPLLLKFKSTRYKNMRMYLIGGANFKYDLATRKKLKEEESIKLKPMDIYYDLGVGIDWYLPYFKLSTELKFSHGFFDVLEHDGSIYTTPIDKLKSYGFYFSFHFSS